MAALGPDALGFVFWKGSPRCVAPGDVRAWTRDLGAEVLKVGVFVDLPPTLVGAAAEEAGLDVVQLHGTAGTQAVRVAWPRVWQVVHLDAGAEPAGADWGAEAFVVDSRTEERPGGTGRTCDWDRAASFVARSVRPVVLAGGLSPDNVAAAVRRVRPWGVDVSTGVEAAPGRKDIAKVEAFVAACRSA